LKENRQIDCSRLRKTTRSPLAFANQAMCHRHKVKCLQIWISIALR
jgi:hypothetical protein